MGDPGDPLERLERRVTGEDALRHRREPAVGHGNTGFKERLQGVQCFEVGGELALDGEGSRPDPAAEVRLRPIPLDL